MLQYSCSIINRMVTISELYFHNNIIGQILVCIWPSLSICVCSPRVKMQQHIFSHYGGHTIWFNTCVLHLWLTCFWAAVCQRNVQPEKEREPFSFFQTNRVSSVVLFHTYVSYIMQSLLARLLMLTSLVDAACGAVVDGIWAPSWRATNNICRQQNFRRCLKNLSNLAMVRTCCVVGCNVRSHDRSGKKIENGLSFHCFPAWKQREGEHVSELTKRRRLAWISAVKRPDINFSNIPRYIQVCSKHFHSGECLNSLCCVSTHGSFIFSS